MMTSSLDCSTAPWFKISDFGRIYATTKIITQTHDWRFFYRTVLVTITEQTLTAYVLSLWTSFTFRMGPYEPLAMKPRICEHRNTVNSVFPLLCFIIRLDSFVYLELVLSRKCTHWELRQKHRFQSPLCDWRLSSVLWRQREFGDGRSDVRSHWPRKYSWVSESVSDGDPDVGQEAMTESTLSSWSLSLDEENNMNNAWTVLYDQESDAIR